ncbi:chemotaxis protein CheW [Alteromonas sp. 14N.309.X.WAT.G.H12]|uniref:chemotaxis protein CheW n=1 Tax=Alteromonas sp. 14N.309.X.WAT.G.H12 TaxID=3120824 RepID=UPI002FD0CD1A
MKKSTPFAREDVMQAYLDSLLQEPDDPAEVTANTARLLEQAAALVTETGVEAPRDTPNTVSAVIDEEVEDTKIVPVDEGLEESAAAPLPAMTPVKEQLDEHFQALFFQVAGLTLAVPLITLGGIHRLDTISSLVGKPAWFKGVMLHREEKISVVDTAMWVMPEKYDQNLAETLNYQYLIMLGDSLWGLASDKLINTVTLTKDEVKWRKSGGKRPWLAGMVKERMCALVDVYQLITMLNNGLGSNEQTP